MRINMMGRIKRGNNREIMTENLTPQEKINIYKNIFIGRKDVFAVYWENKDKTKKRLCTSLRE